MAVEIIGEELLAGAIVITACRDYLECKTKIRDNPDDEKLVKECEFGIKSILRFFRSNWYSVLTKLDPDYLIDKLNKKFEDGDMDIGDITVF